MQSPLILTLALFGFQAIDWQFLYRWSSWKCLKTLVKMLSEYSENRFTWIQIISGIVDMKTKTSSMLFCYCSLYVIVFIALLQRSLELIIYYLPLIKQQFSVYLIESKSAMLRHLDSVADEYRQHVRVVKEKLVELASGMIESCVSQVNRTWVKAHL